MAEPVVLVLEVDDRGTEKLGRFSNQVDRAFENVSTSARKSEKEVDQFNKTTGQTVKSTDAASKSLLGFLNQARPLPSVFNQAGKSVISFVGGLGAIAGAGAGIAATVRTISQFQLAFAQVTTLVDTSVVDVARLRDEISSLPPILGSATELTEGLYQALSAGVEPAQAVRFVADAAKLATAGLTDARAATDVLTTVINAYGLAASDAGRISDILFKTVEQGKTTVEELSSSLGQAIPLAAQLEIDFTQLTAAVATLTKGGLSTSEAITGLRSAFANIIQNAQKFADVGINVNEVLSGPNGFIELLRTLRERFGDNEGAIRQLVPDVQGLTAVLALTGTQFSELENILQGNQNSLGATERAFQKVSATISQQISRIGNAFAQLALAFGGEGGDVLTNALGAIASGIEAVTRSADDIRALATLFGTALVRAFAAPIDVVGALIRAIGDLGNTLANLVGSIPGIRGLADPLRAAADSALAAGEAITGFAERLQRDALAVEDALFKEAEAIEKVNVALMANTTETEKAFDATSLFTTSVNALQLENAAAATSTTELASANEQVSESLDEVSTSASGASKQVTVLKEGVEGVIQEFRLSSATASDFQDAIDGIVNETNALANAHGIAADEVRALTNEFAANIQQGIDLANQLARIGITQDQLVNSSSGLTAEQIEVAESLGITADRALELLNQFRSNAQATDQLAERLRSAGVDVGSLSQEFVKLGTAAQRLGPSLEEVETALKVITGTTSREFTKLAANFTRATDIIIASGRRIPAELTPKIRELLNQAKELGVELPRAITEGLDAALVQVTGFTNETLNAFETLGVELPRDTKRAADNALNAFKELRRNGGLEFDQLRRIFTDEVVPKLIAAGQRIPPAFERFFNDISNSARKAGNEIENTLTRALKENAERAKQLRENIIDVRDIQSLQIPFSRDIDTLREQIAFLEQGRSITGAELSASGIGELEFRQREARELLAALRVQLASVIEEQRRADEVINGTTGTNDRFNDSLSNTIRLGTETTRVLGTSSSARTGFTASTQSALNATAAFTDALEDQSNTLRESVSAIEERANAEAELARQRVQEEVESISGRATGTIEVIAPLLGRTVTGIIEAADELGLSFNEQVRRIVENTRNIADPLIGPAQTLFDAANAAGLVGNSIINAALELLQGGERSGLLIEDSATRAARLLREAGLDAASAIESAAQSSAETLEQASPSVTREGELSANQISAFIAGRRPASPERQITSSTTAFSARQTTNSLASASEQLRMASTNLNQSSESLVLGTNQQQVFSGLPFGADGRQLDDQGLAGVFGPGTLQALTSRQNGVFFATQGEVAKLEAGEAVLPRIVANAVREGVQAGVSTNFAGRGSTTIDGLTGSTTTGVQAVAMDQGFFRIIRGVAAQGKQSEVMGNTAKRDQAAAVTSVVRAALRRRDVTRDVTRNTPLTRTGVPTTQ